MEVVQSDGVMVTFFFPLGLLGGAHHPIWMLLIKRHNKQDSHCLTIYWFAWVKDNVLYFGALLLISYQSVASMNHDCFLLCGWAMGIIDFFWYLDTCISRTILLIGFLVDIVVDLNMHRIIWCNKAQDWWAQTWWFKYIVFLFLCL